MAAEYVKILEGEQPVLLATLVSSGLQQRYFEAATGLQYGVQRHKYESHVHSVSKEDMDRLREAIAERAGSEPEFWPHYIDRCASKGKQLLTTAQSLAKLAEEVHPPQELAVGFTAFAEATKQLVPFLAATPTVRTMLESLLTRRLAAELPAPTDQEKAAQGLRLLLVRSDESEALRETRDFYRLVLTVMKDGEALDLVRNTSPAIAVDRLERDFPGIYDLMRDHAKAHGRLRTRGSGCEPRTPKELVERMQAVVLRWGPETVREAAQPKPTPDVEQLLGFSPSESLAQLIGWLQDLIGLRCSRVDAHLQANCITTTFFAKVAESLGCTREQLLFSSVEEIVGALTNQAEFPAPDVDVRIHNSFSVERALDDVRVRSHGTPPEGQESEPAAAALTGMTASRGRAVGRVRIILAAPQVHKLEVGDVLVTATSTPDAMGGESVFPTRAGPPLGIENAAAIVTDEGGFLSHAAIVARERGIPCVVGTERATSALADGQVVEVDATQPMGRVIALDPR